ncbi:hypothetical protein CEXT_296931 [Caerostris extrusa]|uniref:Uncharacterized protein n=1 Tax=Caerostris extrusa TaxID=172846 RepID=A0AAV4XDS0_CAEEX|nr:hypothetical protein CEXT_296931 [Caerostris extrusa]
MELNEETVVMEKSISSKDGGYSEVEINEGDCGGGECGVRGDGFRYGGDREADMVCRRHDLERFNSSNNPHDPVQETIERGQKVLSDIVPLSGTMSAFVTFGYGLRIPTRIS